MASSLDQVGVMTKTVADSEILLKAIAGFDEHDAQSDHQANEWKKSPTPLKIAVPKEAFAEGLDPVRVAGVLLTLFAIARAQLSQS